MIGDIVAVNNTPLQIAALGTVKAGFIDAKGEMFYQYYDNIEPISLTAEILEKNGLDKDGFFEEDMCSELHLSHYKSCGKTLWCYKSHIILGFRYVHELQHALRLCGIEKEIVL